MADQPTTATPASAWRRATQDGELIRLPGSGNVARLIRPSLIALAATQNGVPNPLTAEVQKFLSGNAPPKSDGERWQLYQRNARAYMEVAALCLKEPRLRLDGAPGEDEIGPGDLADLDYTWIYHNWLEGTAADAVQFRVTVGNAADRRASTALWDAAEHPAG